MDTISGIFGNLMKRANPFSDKQGAVLLSRTEDVLDGIQHIQKGTAVLISGISRIHTATIETNRHLKSVDKSLRRFRSEVIAFEKDNKIFQFKQTAIARENRLRDLQFQKDSRNYFRESTAYLYKISNKKDAAGGGGFLSGLLGGMAGGLKKMALTIGAGLAIDKIAEQFLGIKPSDILVGMQTFFREGGIMSKIGDTISGGYNRMGGWIRGLNENEGFLKSFKDAFSDTGIIGRFGSYLGSGFTSVQNWIGGLNGQSGIIQSIKNSFSSEGMFGKIGEFASTARGWFGSARSLFAEGGSMSWLAKGAGKLFKPLDAIFAISDGLDGIAKEGDKIGNTLAFTKHASAGFLGGFLDLGEMLNPLNAIDKFILGKKDAYKFDGKEKMLKFVDESQAWLSDQMTEISEIPDKISKGYNYLAEGKWTEDISKWWDSWKVDDWSPIKSTKEWMDKTQTYVSDGFSDISNWWKSFSITEWGPVKWMKSKFDGVKNLVSDWWNGTSSATSVPAPQTAMTAPAPLSLPSAPTLAPNTTDSVLAGLTPGEIVIPKDIAQTHSATLGNIMNDEPIPMFAEGGVVPFPGSVPMGATPATGNGMIEEVSMDSSKIKDVSFEKAKIENINLGTNPNEVGGFWDSMSKSMGFGGSSSAGQTIQQTGEKIGDWAAALNSKAQQMMWNPSADQQAFSKNLTEAFNKVTGGIISTQDETRVDFNSPFVNKAAYGYGNINAAQRRSLSEVGTEQGQINPMNVAPAVTGNQQTASSIPTRGVSPISGGQKDMMKSVYNAFAQAGFSENQAKALTAEVGRENDFNSKYVFGAHSDAANNAKNIGFFSWQKERASALQKDLEAKGLWKDGKMVQGQESLNTMANFAKKEMESGQYKGLGNFMENKNVDSETAANQLGKGYIKWAMGQDVLKNGERFDWRAHHAKRAGHYNAIDQIVQSEKGKPTREAGTPQTAQATGVAEYSPYVLQNKTSVMSPENTMTDKEFQAWQTQTNAGVALGKTLAEMRASEDMAVRDLAEKVQLTSGNKGAHVKESLHYKGTAFDFNRMNMSPQEQELFSQYAQKQGLVRDVKVGGKIEPWHYSYRGEDQFKQTATAEKPANAPTDLSPEQMQAQVEQLNNVGIDNMGKMNMPSAASLYYSRPAPSVAAQASNQIMNAGIKQEASRFPVLPPHQRAPATKPDLSIMGGGSSDGVAPASGGTANYDLNPYSNMSEFMRMSMLRGVSTIPGAPVGY